MPDNERPVSTDRQIPRYEYPEATRRKHKWCKDEAGFEEQSMASGKKTYVGKCPRSMTPEQAQSLLDEAIAFPKHADTPDGEKIYFAVDHNGVIYVGYLTNPETPSYHGMPWRKHGNTRIPRTLYDELRKLAERKNAVDGFTRWWKHYGSQ